MSVIKTEVLHSLADTKRIAEQIAAQTTAGDVIALAGEVGVGKTTFAQFLISSLLAKPESVTSPTFTLVQRYETKHGFLLLHADLYRLKHPNELLELGLEEAFETHLCLIEWPEIAENLLPEQTLYITLLHTTGNERSIELHSRDTKWNTHI